MDMENILVVAKGKKVGRGRLPWSGRLGFRCKLLYREWIKKMWYRYIMEYYSAIKKE